MTSATRSIALGGQRYPLVLPSPRDPRLHVAMVIITIHVLGQVGLGFHVTIPQILAAILACAIIEVTLTFRRSRAFVWPASAMLTGSGVALILRSTTTPAGDPWGFEDWWLFAAIAAGALLTKYVIQYRGSHVFNPSNVGLVVAFILIGAERIQPLDFWWGPLDVWLAIAYVVIIVGGSLITRRLHLLTMAATYWLTLAVGMGILAASGHCMVADWSLTPVCGERFWWTIVVSPEVLIFLFFMITDPKTIPSGPSARIAFAVTVGVLSAILIAPQTTEFGAKVALLASLTITCLARPIFERFLPAADRDAAPSVPSPAGWAERLAGRGATRPALRLASAVAAVIVVGGGIVLAGAPARPSGEAIGSVPGRAIAAVDPDTLPTVTIDPDVTEWNLDRVRQDAPMLALTLARMLEAENEALLEDDDSRLAELDHGGRLDEMTARLEAARGSGETTIHHYSFDKLFLTVRLLARQSGLGMAFDAEGTVTDETYAPDGSLVRQEAGPFAETFVLRQVFGDERWFIVGVVPDAPTLQG